MLIVPAAMAADLEEQAYDHLRKSEWTEARRDFETELIANPKNLDARYNLALLLAKSGHPDSEKKLYLENMKYGWHLPSVINLSSIYIAEGSNRDAQALLEKAARHFRHEATPRYLLAELYEKQGDRKKALQWYEDALKSDPLNGFAQIRYARFIAGEKNYPEAIKHGERAASLIPDSASIWSILGDIQVATGHDDKALESYQRSLALQPSPETRQRLINLLHRLGEHERANRMQQALDAWVKHQGS